MPAQKLAASGRWLPLPISYACSGIGIVGSYHRNRATGYQSTRKGSWTNLDPFGSSITAARRSLLHPERVGGLLLPISYACSGIGIVGSYHRKGNRRFKSTRKALDSTICGSFGYTQLPAQLAASEKVGGLCRYQLCACSGIGIVGSYHQMGQRAACQQQA
jgi:hypothetical protein